MEKLLLSGVAVTLNGVGKAVVYSYDVFAWGVKRAYNVAKKTPSAMGKVKERSICRVCRGSHRACIGKCNVGVSWGPYPNRIDKKAKKAAIRGWQIATEMRRNDHVVFSYGPKLRKELPNNRE